MRINKILVSTQNKTNREISTDIINKFSTKYLSDLDLITEVEYSKDNKESFTKVYVYTENISKEKGWYFDMKIKLNHETHDKIFNDFLHDNFKTIGSFYRHNNETLNKHNQIFNK
jgi:hypothetical protein